MADKKYFIEFKGFNTSVPSKLAEGVRRTVTGAFAGLDVEIDFAGKRAARDLLLTFTLEVPPHPVYGESSRPSMNDVLLSGDATVFVGAMKAMRLQLGTSSCEAAFPDTAESLGALIANTTVHETGHMLGLDIGGYDDGGHTTDPENYMWDAGSMPGDSTRVSQFFEYVVKKGDTLSSLVHRFIRGTLDPCRLGATTLTYSDVWDFPPNKGPGFIRDPKKGGIARRRADNPNWIYPGEKVAFPSSTLRVQAYRRNFPGFLGEKTFTSQQVEVMKKFIAKRLEAGK
jgi:LysM domain